MLKEEATKDKPFLNNIDHYESIAHRTKEDDVAIEWDVLGMQRHRRSHCSTEKMEQIYNQVMNYFMTNEWHLYQSIQTGQAKHEDYERDVNDYLIRTFPEMRVEADRAIILDRVRVATYQYSVLQPLIDNPDTSDIKVCGPKDIRVRIHGKAYKSNATFYDAQELYRFITGIAMRNHLALDKPMITFTDTGDPHYILRFVISSPMINAIDYPYMHIRKVPKNKPDFDRLIKDEMLPPIVKDYLIDRAKMSRGVVFAGPPGCVDAETEYFNGNGWKKISEYTKGEKVLQFNTNTNEATLVEPIEYIKVPCDEMYHFETKEINQTLSEEHNIIYYNEENKPINIFAKEFVLLAEKHIIKGKFRIDYKNERYSDIPTDLKVERVKPIDGYKYCFTTPTHALVLRRKGHIFITGNSGKTTALNAFIEYIPKTRETLVIQENDELFTNQSGFMFKHVTHGFQNEPIVTLEDLAKMALVEGCNEFVVGEVKGGEMRYVMTLLNAGGYAALTVHSTNAYETMDKLADLVKYGSDYSFDEARRMLKTFDTVVYMENYQIQEILEVDGYDDETHQFNYINIYKNPHPRGM